MAKGSRLFRPGILFDFGFDLQKQKRTSDSSSPTRETFRKRFFQKLVSDWLLTDQWDCIHFLHQDPHTWCYKIDSLSSAVFNERFPTLAGNAVLILRSFDWSCKREGHIWLVNSNSPCKTALGNPFWDLCEAKQRISLKSRGFWRFLKGFFSCFFYFGCFSILITYVLWQVAYQSMYLVVNNV